MPLLHGHRLRLAALVAGLGAVLAWPASAAPSRVSIRGLQTVSDPQAREWIASQLQFVESAGVSRARADDLAFFLENAMRDQGYSKATVDWRVEGAGEAARILLDVSEGHTVFVGKISVEGNVALEDDAVVELLTSATRKRLGKGDGETIPYVKQDIEDGRLNVVAFYGLLGYRKAEVALDAQTEGSRANLVVRIDEGVTGRVGEIVLPEAPDPQLAQEFEKIRREFAGKTHSAGIASNLGSRIREAAVDAGYFNARVDVEEREAAVADGTEQIDLVVAAIWGRPVSISGVRIAGNKKVKTAFFERHFDDLVGQPYSPGRTNENVNELLKTGAFETVRTHISEQDDGSHLLDIEIEEGYSRTLGVYGGFTNYEGPIGGFEFRNLNLFGMVRKADAAIEFSQRGARGEAEYTDPWFLDSPFQMRLGLFALNRAEEGYEKFRTGGRYEFSRSFGRKKRDTLALFGEAAYTDVHKADIAPLYLGERTYFSHQIGLSFTHDRRDDPRRPRKGYIAQTSLATASSAFGSDIEYLKATGRLGFYFPVGDHTLRLGARAGFISPTGDTDDIPIDLRFFNGGPFSVRSFRERELGQHDPASGYAVGGSFYTIFNAEYEIPVPGVPGLSVVPFADAGNLIFDDSDASLDDLRYALGLGLRYETPIGPLRVEYGFNPDQRPGEPQGTFHVGFGLGY
ncbi:MAG TPA: BamA/TamA family outer membrane protein [Bacteroidia bacterium]|nr:BamA/TamA family outer membrane protein [Bacteroidia bacterium]